MCVRLSYILSETFFSSCLSQEREAEFEESMAKGDEPVVSNFVCVRLCVC